MKTHYLRMGLVEYEDALRMQAQLVEARQKKQVPDHLLLLEHPHVFTLGRRAMRENILIDEKTCQWWDVKVFETGRGGNVTYHGPGQLVLYPILALPPSRQDVARYVRGLEEVMIRVLKEFDISGSRIPGLSGVWVGEEKIGAIGVRMSRWVTSHGLALNVNTDLRYFGHIIPCGIRDRGVTSMQRLLGQHVNLKEVGSVLLRSFSEVFELELAPHPFDMLTIQALVYQSQPALRLLNLHRMATAEDFWQPVTGRIEAGETPIQAAAREVLEETGLTGMVRDMNYVHSFMLDPSVFEARGWPFPCFVQEHSFSVEVSPDARVRLDPRTHSHFRWLPPNDSMALQRWPGNREAVRQLSRQEAPTSAPPAGGSR